MKQKNNLTKNYYHRFIRDYCVFVSRATYTKPLPKHPVFKSKKATTKNKTRDKWKEKSFHMQNSIQNCIHFITFFFLDKHIVSGL